jgi:3'-phosphoadenosine 5'-phosphosulfate sulfotransferase (PAPS reductase)/FAD synthetase
VSHVTVLPEYGSGLAQIHLEDPEFMRTLAEQAAEELADAPAEEVIRWAADTFGERICITSSMTDAVIIHLASAVKPGIDVVFLDTGYTSRRRSGPGTRSLWCTRSG